MYWTAPPHLSCAVVQACCSVLEADLLLERVWQEEIPWLQVLRHRVKLVELSGDGGQLGQDGDTVTLGFSGGHDWSR